MIFKSAKEGIIRLESIPLKRGWRDSTISLAFATDCHEVSVHGIPDNKKKSFIISGKILIVVFPKT
jgi:hypothetical protein